MSIVKLSNISKEYKGKIVFNNFSLAVEKGDYIAVTGKVVQEKPLC